MSEIVSNVKPDAQLDVQDGFKAYADPHIIEGRTLKQDDILVSVHELIHEQGWSFFLQIQAPVYPELVHQFYSLMRNHRQDPSITAVVSGKTFGFNTQNLSEWFHLERQRVSSCWKKGWISDSQDFNSDFCLRVLNNIALDHVFEDPDYFLRRPNVQDLTANRFILLKILKENVITVLNKDKQVGIYECTLLYLLLTHKKINLPSIIIQQMYECSGRQNKPYGMLLTHIFAKRGILEVRPFRVRFLDAERLGEVRLPCTYYSGPVQEPLGSNGLSSGGLCRMSQAAGNDGKAVPHGEPEHVSVHMEASSFTPQQAAPGAGPVPEVVPIIQPQFAANFMNFLQQMAGAYVPPPPPLVVVVTIEKLRKNGAEEFLGDQIADTMISKRWFEQTILVLGNMRVSQDQRGDLAVALLQDSAYDWWKRVGVDVPEPVQWTTFEQLFHEEYIPEHFVEAKRDEFLKSTKGELRLPEYPHLIIAPRGDINALFKNVLDLNAALIKKAEYEQSFEVSATPSRPPPPQKAGTSSKRRREKAEMGIATRSATFVDAGIQESVGTQGLCLGCGQAGHFRKECSKNPGELFPSAPATSAPAAQPAQSQKSVAASSQPKWQDSGSQAGKAPARTYAMRGRTEQPAHDVIMGIFTLFDTSITALIDPCSILSYVCMPMPVVPNIPKEDLDDLIILTANQVVVDCGAHTVRLRAKDGSDILIRDELLPKAPEFISYIHARRLIRKKHEAFLCTVRDTRQEAPYREDIPTHTQRQQIASAQNNDDFCIQTLELVSRGE
ncbi:unnamed protein product [Cuscuta campestris]|uniref:CCHC-type domain-containing protein n=1 Tax=Cuscuta campestris TaxID=132261 RepID=A0A484LNZ3_9ASTE|nr:unnamed protein product [Cuscuta campestris]